MFRSLLFIDLLKRTKLMDFEIGGDVFRSLLFIDLMKQTKLSDLFMYCIVELRKATIPMFFDMIQCEFMSVPKGSNRKYKGDFRKVSIENGRWKTLETVYVEFYCRITFCVSVWEWDYHKTRLTRGRRTRWRALQGLVPHFVRFGCQQMLWTDEFLNKSVAFYVHTELIDWIFYFQTGCPTCLNNTRFWGEKAWHLLTLSKSYYNVCWSTEPY